MAFLVDDLLLFPFKAIITNVKKAAEEDLKNEEKEVMAGLTGLHHRLESGEIYEKEFDELETKCLNRLEAIQKILHPEPPLTKIQKLQKYYPEEFKTEAECETDVYNEVESTAQNHSGELVVETESRSRLGFASMRKKKTATIRPAGIEPVSMERKASGLQPTKLRSVGWGSTKR